MATQIAKCSCSNKFQDEQYGSQMRVWNLAGKKGAPIFRCTVCKTEKGSSGAAPQASK